MHTERDRENNIDKIILFLLLLIDVAISIPFINSGSSSMIHIYRGSKHGLILKPSQVNKT